MTWLSLQRAAFLVATAFLLIGILGFVPGITTDYDRLEFSGTDSRAQLLGLFRVSILHNLVHVGFGVLGLALARTWAGARAFLVGGGVVYLGVWVYGLAVDRQSDANFLPVDQADNWLHFLLAVTMIALGILLSRGTGAVSRAV